ncbi:hypothetical protein ABTN13_20015, partial [Acinetobacter baumannii]
TRAEFQTGKLNDRQVFYGQFAQHAPHFGGVPERRITPMGNDRLDAVRRAAAISTAVTSVVVVAKLIAARLTGSVSVLSEALQSTTDVVISL